MNSNSRKKVKNGETYAIFVVYASSKITINNKDFF